MYISIESNKNIYHFICIYLAETSTAGGKRAFCIIGWANPYMNSPHEMESRAVLTRTDNNSRALTPGATVARLGNCRRVESGRLFSRASQGVLLISSAQHTRSGGPLAAWYMGNTTIVSMPVHLLYCNDEGPVSTLSWNFSMKYHICMFIK